MTTRQFLLEDVTPLRPASERYAVPFSTLRSWHSRRFLKPVARLPANCPGGGVLVFLRADILALIQDPPQRGRPSLDRGLPIVDLAGGES